MSIKPKHKLPLSVLEEALTKPIISGNLLVQEVIMAPHKLNSIILYSKPHDSTHIVNLLFQERRDLRSGEVDYSIFSIMRDNYEGLPRFETMRYDAEKICGSIIEFSLQPKIIDPQFKYEYMDNPSPLNMILISANEQTTYTTIMNRVYGEQIEKPIFASFKTDNNPQSSTDLSEYILNVQISADCRDLLNDLSSLGALYTLKYDIKEGMTMPKERMNKSLF